MVSEADIVMAVRRLRARVEPRIPIERVVLFGSRARGDAREDSDVDLLVVSPAFEGLSAIRRALPLRRAWDLDVAVDIVCYTPVEFAEMTKRPTLAHIASDEGREIAA